MSDKLKIYCVNTARYIDIAGGESLADIYPRTGIAAGSMPPVCARVNNRTEDLSYPVFSPKMVEYLGVDSDSGQRVYTRSLCMMLYKAVTDLMPGTQLRIEHSISRGLYCRLFASDHGEAVECTDDIVGRLKARMRELAEADMAFVRNERLSKDVADKFRKQGLDRKVLLLETTHDLYTVYYRLGNTADSYYGPLAPSTGYIRVFDLQPYHEGMLLLGTDPADPAIPASPIAQEKMFAAFTDYLRFNHIVGVSTVGELNVCTLSHRTPEVINTAEAMHNKIMARLADSITERHARGTTRIVLAAGPSSSGKTTSAKRLAIQLMTNLITPRMISLDDYFVDRDKTPLDADGEYDYESLHALDLDRFNADINALLAGKTINLPTYSFELGRRVERDRPLKLGPHDILIIEGIHGLNPELSADIPDESIFRLYISALTTLSIDDHNWISTTDNRLLRRIVRDNRYRHTSALDTLKRWPSVRRGEEKWIFPFQENADATFNSSLIYELGVMKEFAEPLLRQVPKDVPQFAQASRLMRLLDCFVPIPLDHIPSTSLLREFLGGSSFKY